MDGKSFPVKIPSRIYWRLIFSYDNSNNAGEIIHEFRTKIFQSFSSSNFTETLTSHAYEQAEKEGIDVTVGGAFEALSASVGASFENSTEVQDFVSTHSTQQTDEKVESEHDELRKYVIGAFSKLELYQLYFSSAGVEYACNALRTDPLPIEEFDTVVVVKQWKLVSGVQVVYGDSQEEKPINCISEINDRDPDINDGFGGKYVWLVPDYTFVSVDATTSFKIRVQDHADDTKPDLAKGAGGAYRYLDIERNIYQRRKVVHLTLLRSESAQDKLVGWDGMTADINSNRGGDYLYLFWKSVSVVKSEVAVKGDKKSTVFQKKAAHHRN